MKNFSMFVAAVFLTLFWITVVLAAFKGIVWAWS